MSRTYRNKERSHDRGKCPWCQENLHHKHSRHETPLFEEDEDEYEPDHVVEQEDD